MKKNTPILIIGLGSIGSRHWRNLVSLGFSNIHAYDTDKKKLVKLGIPALATLTPEVCRQFSVVFVCNPTAQHVPAALIAAKAGCHLFIEKPLSHTSKNIPSLLKAMRPGKVAMVACNNRFYAGFTKLESQLKSKKLGKPLSATVTFTRDLTRGGTDKQYAKSYAAQKRGGGVVFDLGPHVVEYLSALFGPVETVSAELDKKSSLRIMSEDYATGVLSHSSGVSSTFALDYYRKPKRHSLEVVCEKGTIEVDFTEDKALSDAMYIDELKHFFNCIDYKRQPLYDLARATEVVRVLESMHHSGKKGKRVRISA
jgi:predicted dehydrogenase